MDPLLKLLIFDDETRFLEIIAQRLRMRGMDVRTAENGPDGLALIREQSFDVVLLDLKMPGMDGTEVLRKLRKLDPLLETVILTGHGSLRGALELTALGAFGYLPKPYELDKLIETLVGAYAARLRNKLGDSTQLQQAVGLEHPMARLRALRDLDRA